MLFLTDPMARYKSRRAGQADPLLDFEVLGYIAAGTYGRVYKARERTTEPRLVAIKKFKTEKPGSDVVQFTGLSQSAYRELGLCRELHHPNVVELITTILYDKAIYLVFEYAEHDLLQLIQYHCSVNSSVASNPATAAALGSNASTVTPRMPSRLAPSVVKSILYQVCAGVAYLHANSVLHRDLKPANIMITRDGRVKIGDLGLARQFKQPLQSLYAGDKVVVTVWYRAPELLLGCRHYTPAIDMWATGCIFAEMLSLRPIFKGEEVTMAPNKNQGGSGFQRDQMDKMTKILGTPTPKTWPAITSTPEYRNLEAMPRYKWCLDEWHRHFDPHDPGSLALLQRLLDYNPDTRISALATMEDPYLDGVYKTNCFENQPVEYPSRRVSTSDVNMAAPPKRSQPQPQNGKKRRH